jgi:anti-sigma factor RsiW
MPNTNGASTNAASANAASTDDLLLERYLDGELDVTERASVEARLRSDPDARERFEALSGFEAGLRSAIDARVSRLPEGALWARIEAGLAEEQAPARRAPAPTLLERVKAWFTIPPMEFALSAGAVAAAVVVGVWMSRTAPPPAAAAPEVAVADETGNNTFVVEDCVVDSGTVVIDVPPDDPSLPAVVWYFEDEDGPNKVDGKG